MTSVSLPISSFPRLSPVGAVDGRVDVVVEAAVGTLGWRVGSQLEEEAALLLYLWQ